MVIANNVLFNKTKKSEQGKSCSENGKFSVSVLFEWFRAWESKGSNLRKNTFAETSKLESSNFSEHLRHVYQLTCCYARKKSTTVYKKPNYLVPVTTDLLQACTAESLKWKDSKFNCSEFYGTDKMVIVS